MFSMPISEQYKLQSYAQAKVEYLHAAERSRSEDNPRGGIGVNRRHCRPFHPHGARMVKDGLMTLHRDAGLGKSRRSVLAITDKGLVELERLRKKRARRDRKFA